MRGLVPHDRVCERRSGAVCLASSVACWGCSECSLGSLLASFAPVRSPRRAVDGWGLLHRRECPVVSGEFAGDRDDDDRAGLASSLEGVPALVQPPTAAFSLCL